ncbi:MAG: ROK family protein [Oscillospiraceae bacterium]|nr:ROK family protein [Oscillospiraceae bacterium]
MYRLGIDLGGTNIVAGVVDENYNILAKSSVKTNSPRSAGEIADDMAKVTFDAIEKAGLKIDDIDGFGMGTPGSVEPENGIIIYSNNIGFFNVDIATMMRERTGKDFYIENDANAAAYGEFIAGAGKGTKNFVAITLGTGVGGGVIIDGKIYSGSNHAGAELGHSVIMIDGVPCTCGRNGCWEAYASATALIRQTKQAMIRYPDSLMWQLCGNDIEKVSGITAFNAMRQGDTAGKMVVDKYIDYISIGIANVVNTFQPEIVCIGGGISKEGKTLTDSITNFVKGEDYARDLEKRVQIKTAALGNYAGIIGAAFISDLYK